MTSKEEVLELLNDFAEACGMASEGLEFVEVRDFDGTVVRRLYRGSHEYYEFREKHPINGPIPRWHYE